MGRPLDRWDHVAAVVAVVAGGLLAVSFGQDAGFDAKNYHWYAGYQLIFGRLDIDVAPAQIQGYFNPLLHLPLWFTSHVFGARGAAFVLGGLHGVGPWLVWLVVRRLGAEAGPARSVAALAALCALSGFVGPIELVSWGTSSGDALVPVFVLGSLLLLLPGASMPAVDPGRAAVVLSGALVGVAVGLKPTVGMYAVGVVVALLIAPPWAGGRRSTVLWCAGAGLALAAVAGPWMLNLTLRYGNPVFPLANNLFESAWAVDFSYSEDRLLPRSAKEAFAFPLAFARGGTHGWEVPFRDARIVVAGVVGALWAVGSIRREAQRPLRFLWLVLLVSYVLWIQVSAVYRYLGVLELLLPSLIVLSIVGRRMTAPRIALALALLIAIGLSVRLPNLRRLPFSGPSAYTVPIPEVEAGSVVLIAGSDALSYFVPSLPPDVRVLRPWSSLSTHTDATRMNRRIIELLADHEGPVYLLEGPNPTVAAEVVGYFGFEIGDCTYVRTRLDPEVTLCRLTRSAR